jgi:glycine/D-amino acid oxidase-like deaminating enzyme
MGAWAVSQPQFSRAFFVATDFMVVTEPIPDRLAEIGWTSYTGIGDSRENFYYLRPTDDGRIAIGGGSVGVAYGDRISGTGLTSTKKAAIAANGLFWLFPQLRGVRFAQAWSGPMDLTAAFVPFFTTNTTGNVHAGLGFSGHGLAATKLGGKTLASLVLHVDDEWSSLPVVGPPLSQLPPEPLRWPLLQAVVWAVDSGDWAQERGRRRGALRGLVASSVTAYRDSRRRR